MRRVVVVGTAALVAMSGYLGAAAAAPGSAGSGHGLVSVAQGPSTAALAAGTPLGATAAATKIQVSFILRARHLRVLERRVQAGWGHHYLSTAQFAAQYGQTTGYVRALQAYLHGFGITTHAYADRLDVSARGTAKQFNKALKVLLRDYRVHATSPTARGSSHLQTVYGTRANPKMPADLAGPILAVLGLSNYSSAQSRAIPAVGHRVTAGARASKAAALPPGQLSPNDFVNRYHLAKLRSGGAKGQGQTLAIITLAAFRPSTPLTFWNKYLGLNVPASRLTTIPIDGGAPGPSADVGTSESDLDVEQSGAVAPKAHVLAYTAPNSDPGFADAFFAAASDNVADTVSTSWGESESILRMLVAQGLETPEYLQAFDEALLEFGAQGQSNFNASGDFGAYDAIGDAATTNLDAGTSDDSPYTTSTGGTTLPGVQTYQATDSTGKPVGNAESANIPAERAWGWDYLWPLHSALGLPDENAAVTDLSTGIQGGAGGGYSVLEPRPSYQQKVSTFNARRYLIPTQFTEVAPGLTLPTALAFNPSPRLTSGTVKRGRAVPDVSANADPQTGYAVYDPDLFPGGFQQEGGTSFTAPQLNGAAAVINSYAGGRVGFWNPAIYRFARSSHSPFRPLNDTKAYSGKRFLFQTNAKGVVTALPGQFSNNNLFYTGTPGRTWNAASGLGLPNLTSLAHAFTR